MKNSDEKLYIKNLIRKVRDGNIHAMYELGLYYCEVNQMTKSKKLIMSAAEKGLAEAAEIVKLIQDKNIKKPMSYTSNMKNLSLLKDIETKFVERDLTYRQLMILKLILHGKTSKQIAKEVNLSFRTVEDHTNRIKVKFNCAYKKDLYSIMAENNCEI